MMITSVAIAIVLWFVISIAIYPTTPRTLHHVPLKVEIAGTSAEENGLSVIDYDIKDVTVQIEGKRSKVGNIEADNLTAEAVVENVTSSLQIFNQNFPRLKIFPASPFIPKNRRLKI